MKLQKGMYSTPMFVYKPNNIEFQGLFKKLEQHSKKFIKYHFYKGLKYSPQLRTNYSTNNVDVFFA